MHHKVQGCHVSMWFAVMLVYHEDTTRVADEAESNLVTEGSLCSATNCFAECVLLQRTCLKIHSTNYFWTCLWGSTLHSAIESNLDYSENQGHFSHFSRKYIWAFAATTIFHHCTLHSLQNLYLVRSCKKAAGETLSFPLFLSVTRNVPALVFDDSSSKLCPVYVLLSSFWCWGCAVLHQSTYCISAHFAFKMM